MSYLPDFEAAEVVGSITRITGVDDTAEAMGIGEVRFYVLRCEVTQVNHKADSQTGAITRIHTVKASACGEVAADTGRHLLKAAERSKPPATFPGQLVLIDDEVAAVEREQRDATDPADVIAADAAERVKAGQ